jgi:hypothetical protein
MPWIARRRIRWNLPPRIDQEIEARAGPLSIQDLDQADRHDAMAFAWPETGGLAIEHDLAH